jgi:hypothetical protein
VSPKAVIYSRFSSELQRDASIEDQIRLCRARIEREGWVFLHAYSDRAISGASALRPAYQSLLEDRGRAAARGAIPRSAAIMTAAPVRRRIRT